ncbi:hypothetical protein [Halorarum salinum]|nr:hypothetical protein [Halobaculum salinum]
MPTGDTTVRALITLGLMATWMLATLGPAFGVSEPISQQVHVPLTALVFLLVGHLWGLEVNKVLSALDGVTISTGGSKDDDE